MVHLRFTTFLTNNIILRNRRVEHAMSRRRPDYLHSGKRSEDSENVQVSGLNVRWQRRSRERCKQQSKDCLVKVEVNYWGDVRQEHTASVAEWLRARDTLTMFEATVCGRS